FGTLKSELFYLNKYESIKQLKKEINEYIKYYNYERIKLNLNGDLLPKNCTILN
ncbi:IS3 family transposase, partial [Aquirufa echingensis]